MSMVCPHCASKAGCCDTRQYDGYTLRRYQCRTDKRHRWSTIEVVTLSGSSALDDVKQILSAISDTGKLLALRGKLIALIKELYWALILVLAVVGLIWVAHWLLPKHDNMEGY